MGRFWAIVTVLMFAIIFLSGCGNGLEPEGKRPVLEFKSKFEVNSKKLSITGNMMRFQGGEIEITVDSPETLSGLKSSIGVQRI